MHVALYVIIDMYQLGSTTSPSLKNTNPRDKVTKKRECKNERKRISELGL